MRILYSTSRIAVRDQCLREVCGLTRTWPDRRALLIVPEQTKMDIERDYLEMSGQSGLMMAEVLSFRRLAWRLLGEIGRQPRQTVDAIGQGMLIHKTLSRHRSELHSFGHLADRPGFIRQAAAALGDLRRYRIDADQLMAASEAAADQALRNKTNDLAVLLRGYDELLNETNLNDAEDDLNRLADLLQELLRLPSGAWPWPFSRLNWLRRTSVWISGFGETRDFTPQEDAVIHALNLLCGELTLTVATDSLPFDRLSVDSGADFCLPGRKTVFRLLQDYPDSSTQMIAETMSGQAAMIAACLREGRRCETYPAAQPDGAGWLRLIRADERDAELSWVAGEIRRLVQLEGYRYRDIALAICDLPGYAPRLRAVCREYNIPLFLDSARPLSGTPLMRLVLSLLDLGLHNWPQTTIMTCLRSGLTPMDPDTIDQLENNMLARGFARPDQEPVFEQWLSLLNALKAADSGARKCELLRGFLVDYGLRARIEKQTEELTAGGEMDAAVAQVKAWNELDRLLEQMTRLTGDTQMPLQTFRDLLAAGMEAAASGVIPTAIDQVTVGDLKQASLRQPKVLFVIGATAALLPPGLPPEGLLKDQDRQTLSGLLGQQLPSSVRDQVFADAFVLYTLLTLPSDRLCMTAPDADVSPWFSWLAQAAPQSLLILPKEPDWDDVRLNSIRPAFGYLLRACGRLTNSGPASEGWLALARKLYDAGLPLTAAVSWLRSSASAESADIKISSGLVRSLYNDPMAMSVSQLEKYASCPFLHFAVYLLALRERPVYQPEASETGTLLHGVVELALAELRLDLAGVDPADFDGRQALIDRWLREGLDPRTLIWMKTAAERDGLQRIFENGLQASVGYRVRRLASASLAAILRQYQQDTFMPSFIEWHFGPGEQDQLTIDSQDGTTISFRGKVDRVDQRQDKNGQYFRIVDYKSGDKKADYEDLYHGLALQLPIYLEAFAKNHPGCQAEDAAYFHFDRPMLNLPASSRPDAEKILSLLVSDFDLRGLKLLPDEIELLRRHSLRQVQKLTASLLDGQFTVAPRKLPNKEAACKYCLMRAVCGFDGSPNRYCRLTPLRGRTNSEGKAVGKREELILRMQCEEDHSEGAL